MGPLKDSLHNAVVAHLLQTGGETILTALNHPVSGSQEVRSTWAELKAEGRNEGMTRQTGLQAVLSERPDLFTFKTTDRGHQLICLNNGTLAAIADGAGASAELGQLALDAAAAADGEERPAKAPRTWVSQPCAPQGSAKGVGKATGKDGKGSPAPAILNGEGHVFEGGIWNGWWYTDIYWTPEMKNKKASESQKESDLVTALYKALEMHAGKSVTLSQLGSDYKVAELKKDPFFKQRRLLDFLREHDNIFEITTNAGLTGGMMVSLQPGAQAALPGAGEGGINDEELLLPDRIKDPCTVREKVQALRIELIYALSRRGGKTAIQDLGQEPRVQKAKQGAQVGQKKLVDWLKLYPDNFALTCNDGAQMIVELASVDASDMSMIDRLLARIDRHDPPPQRSTASRGARDAGRGLRDGGDRGRRDDDRRRERSPRPSPMQAYGYPVPHYGPPQGPPPGYGGYGCAPPGYPPPTPHQAPGPPPQLGPPATPPGAAPGAAHGAVAALGYGAPAPRAAPSQAYPGPSPGYGPPPAAPHAYPAPSQGCPGYRAAHAAPAGYGPPAGGGYPPPAAGYPPPAPAGYGYPPPGRPPGGYPY